MAGRVIAATRRKTEAAPAGFVLLLLLQCSLVDATARRPDMAELRGVCCGVSQGLTTSCSEQRPRRLSVRLSVFSPEVMFARRKFPRYPPRRSDRRYYRIQQVLGANGPSSFQLPHSKVAALSDLKFSLFPASLQEDC